jgi:hypothetical protein
MVDHIPCLFLPYCADRTDAGLQQYDDVATKILIYFHGNAEDIGLAFDLLYMIGQRLQIHVLAVEYPGYGLYKSSYPNEKQIKEDSIIVYDYLTKCVGIN